MTDGDRSTRRRDLLRAVGATAFATSVAGCSALTGGSDEPATDQTQAGTTSAPATNQGTEANDGTTDDDGQPAGVGPTAGIEACPAGNAGGGDVVEIGGTVTEDTTLGSEASEYLVTSSLDVEDGAVLTVEPGTKLRFAQDTSLVVRADSALSAVGNCAEPVVFTGDQATRGFWKGIFFEGSDRVQSELTYAVVEYGGGDSFIFAPARANVVAIDGARLRIDSSSLRESDAYGLAYSGSVTVDSFEQNVLTANGDGAAYVSSRSAHFLSDGSTYTGNDEDRVAMHGADIGADFEGTWDALDVPYTVETGDNIRLDGELTIAPGTTVEFGQGVGLLVSEDGPGSLRAVGMDPETEEVQPITFTGAQRTRGYWKGVGIVGSDQTPSRFEHVVFEYGGGDDYIFAPGKANLAVWDGSRVNVANCTFRESDAYGFAFSGSARVDAFVQNTVTANASGAGLVSSATTHVLSDTGTYTGNDEDFVLVRGATIPGDDEVTWDAIDAPYRVQTGENVQVDGHLTVDPGTTVEFGQGASMTIEENGPGRLTAVGIDPDTEESQPITFTGEQQTRGYWDGIAFRGTDRTENQLRNCVVEYGGGDDWIFAPARANVVVFEGSRVRIDDCTLRESDAYGFAFSGSAKVDSFTTNTVTRNASGAGRVASSTTHPLSDSGTYTGNDEDIVLVRGDTIGSRQTVTWDAIDVPYRVNTDDNVEVNGHLTVDPGTTVEFGQGASMTIEEDGPGALTAVGESGRPITFTGEQRTAGFWDGIAFRGTARRENQLHRCVVEYGGRDDWIFAPGHGNVVVFEGSTLSLQNSTLRNGSGYGLAVSGDSTVSSSGNTFSANGAGAQN
ncbi:hypothetical protein [Haloarchaeobius litoreus]|uniref:Right handed beta helix region n=1 Tax=Haloarchaeobius litoreus TaxID=755306 RepID=A0ABD6DMQ4_9EURY|nr:hypothetical protein [Haloarchaeobius litoreus]